MARAILGHTERSATGREYEYRVVIPGGYLPIAISNCHKPFSLISLKSHLFNKHLSWRSRSISHIWSSA
jgi:hypothetical protein